jgi:carbon-monoxide dehydrogenase large subunit
MKRLGGESCTRLEDQRLVTGRGRFTADIELPGQAVLYIFRSPYVHGRISHLDISGAGNVDGVLAVYTIADLDAAGYRDLVGCEMPASSYNDTRPPVRQPLLARHVVRYVGEPVVAIVAMSVDAAKHAAELIEMDVEDYPVAMTTGQARSDGAVILHEAVSGNLLGKLEYGDPEATEKAFASAAHVVSLDLVNNRVAPVALEPRGCIASHDASSNTFTLYQGCQGVHRLRESLLHSVPCEEHQLQVICPDVGGGFGLKFFAQCETAIALFAAQKLKRPIRWIADRTESFLSDLQGRDHVSHARLALDADNRFLAMRVSIDGNVGAYTSEAGALVPWWGASMTPGCYRIPAVYTDISMYVTNTVPLDAYRGAGRPEAAYLVERLVDKAAIELGVDALELRRQNFIAADMFPYETATGQVYDSGDYSTLMDRAASRADWRGFEERRQESLRRGRLRGIGLSYYVEVCAAFGGEHARVSMQKTGRLEMLVGTQSTGQGHETSFCQIAADRLGIAKESIDFVQGDTRRIFSGMGTAGSRSMAIGGSALVDALENMIEHGRSLAAHRFGCEPDAVEFLDGYYVAGNGAQQASFSAIAGGSFSDDATGLVPEGLAASGRFFADAGGTFPNGCHICELEIDPDTGSVEVLAYTVEDDLGRVINPLLVEGQITGGIAQALGQALSESVHYDPETGQLLTASLVDYAMPRADWVPPVNFAYQEIPSPRNPLGVKGAGEAGTIGGAPAVVNAVVNALSGYGIRHLDMPLTPLRIWQALGGRSAEARKEKGGPIAGAA